MESVLLKVNEAQGNPACNVDTMMSYAADQLGLSLTQKELGEGYGDYSAVLTGDSGLLSHLISLLGSAYPQASISVRPYSL